MKREEWFYRVSIKDDNYNNLFFDFQRIDDASEFANRAYFNQGKCYNDDLKVRIEIVHEISEE